MGVLENVADPATGAHGALSASGGIKTAVNGLFTGTFTTGNAKTATVVNGLIVGVV